MGSWFYFIKEIFERSNLIPISFLFRLHNKDILSLILSLLFNKVASLQGATLLKKAPAQVFPVNFCESFKNTNFAEHVNKMLPTSSLSLLSLSICFDFLVRILISADECEATPSKGWTDIK